jgi:hypothetical protein
MIKNKTWPITAGMATLIALIMLLIPHIFPPCNGMVETAMGGAVPMKCHWTFQAEVLVAATALLAALGQFFLKGVEARRLSAVFLILLAVMAILLPQSLVIGICIKAGMACGITKAWTVGAAILLLLLGLYQIFSAAKSGN